jgi:hypothetical protein
LKRERGGEKGRDELAAFESKVRAVESTPAAQRTCPFPPHVVEPSYAVVHSKSNQRNGYTKQRKQHPFGAKDSRSPARQRQQDTAQPESEWVRVRQGGVETRGGPSGGL